jgi:hypothetical protein
LGRFDVKEIARNLTKWEARGIEQAAIEKYGLTKGGQLWNKINSISNVRTIYKSAVKFGEEWLRENLPKIGKALGKDGISLPPKEFK